MLTVTFVSMCRHRAHRTTRRILDAYAQRIGKSTWCCPVTMEGLEAIHRELRHIATRAHAIACYQMQSRGKLSLLWIVGNRTPFGRDAAVPVRTTIHGHRALKNRLPFDRADDLKYITAQAGVAHDIGKVTGYFQKKLKDQARICDPVRHEWVSVALRERLLQQPDETIEQGLRAVIPELCTLTPESAYGLGLPHSVDDVIQWIVATHHRLPRGGPSGITFASHVSGFEAAHVRWTDGSEKALDRSSDLAARIRGERAQPEQQLSPDILDALFLYGRLAMMLSDHFISALPEERVPELSTGVLAKSARKRPQDLAFHLIGVERGSRRVVRQLVRWRGSLPALYPESRKQLDRQSRGRWVWQNHAVKLCKEVVAQKTTRGCIVLVSASTGSGKTRACAKIVSALSGERGRWTVALGLRTLTLQTGDAYRRELGIQSADLSVQIGSIEHRLLHEAGNEEQVEPEDTEMEHIPLLAGGAFSQHDLPQEFVPQLRRKADEALLLAPVLICTIDYLMNAADWRRSRHLLASLRLAGSDIILDEVDAYDLEDYPALSRFCFVVGLYGRRLLLSTATPMPEMVSLLISAYQAGYRRHAGLTGRSSDIDFVTIDDRIRPTTTVLGAGCTPQDSLEKHLKRLRDHLAKSTISHRRAVVRQIETSKQLARVTEDLFQMNALQYEGISYAIGLIRVASIREAMGVAAALSASPELQRDKRRLVVIPYHGAMPLAVRNYTERWLDRWLTRKNHDAPDPITQSSYFEDTMDEVLIIVVATPVEEVGRDHCFDFAIIEPSSIRSVLQCCGRVRRHRHEPLADGVANVALFERNIRAQRGYSPAYIYPGFEGRSEGLKFSTRGDDAYNFSRHAHRTIKSLQPVELLRQHPEDSLAQWEADNLKRVLLETAAASFLYAREALYCTRHFDNYPFRGRNPQSRFYFHENNWYAQNDLYSDVEKRFPLWSDSTGLWIDNADVDRILEDTREAVNADTIDRKFSRSYMRVEVSARPTDESLVAHPIFGIFRKDPFFQ